MKDRIQKIIEQKQMSVSQFADVVGIQRSTLHHIIKGRNNPSLDVVCRIHEVFPEIDLDWLITGNSVNTPIPQEGTAIQQELFPDENPILPPPVGFQSENRTLREEQTAVSTTQDICKSMSYNKKITKIIVVYSDGSTDSFEK